MESVMRFMLYDFFPFVAMGILHRRKIPLDVCLSKDERHCSSAWRWRRLSHQGFIAVQKNCHGFT